MGAQFYEKVVKEKNTPRNVFKKISVIMCYALIMLIFVFVALSYVKLFLQIILLGLFAEILIISLTWKFLYKEYEYSFEYGRMTISKIYGKKKRKIVFETDVDTMLIIAPATDEYIAKAEHFGIDKRVVAVSDQNAEDIWLVVSGGDDERRILAFFEADERSLEILRSENIISFVRKK